jgi:hypothetical protein
LITVLTRAVHDQPYMRSCYDWRLIGRGPKAPVSWPPRSPDFNPIDFYLWGSTKNAVYTNIIDARQQIWQRIQDASNEIRTTPGVFERVSSIYCDMRKK